MGTIGTKARGRSRLALTAVLLLAVLAALLLAGSALAAGHEGQGKAARPGRPSALTPSGAVSTATPTFTWSKARGATRYELRVYEAGELLLARAGISGRSWTSRLALPTGVDLSWKVRGSKAGKAGAWSASRAFRVAPLSAAKALTSFSFAAPPASGVIIEALHSVALTVPAGTSLSALVASFTTTGASVAIAGTPQVSGVTANNFANPVTYTVSAADGTTQAYLVTVTVAAGPGPTPSAAKAITAFSFQGLAPPVVGTVNEAAHTIALTVPAGTNLTALVATFTTTGASVKVGAALQVSGVTANSFTNPVTYTVSAADGTTQAYTVTVTLGGAAAKAITAFSFQGLAPPVVGVINDTAHTIALTVPAATSRTALVATFTTSGTSLTIAGTAQVSGATANNFTSPVTYTVTAADASTQSYVVTVTLAAAAGLAIGDPYQGGVVAYILQSGDPGYVAGEARGLIAATADQSTGIRWYNGFKLPIVGTGTGLGTGRMNTAEIIIQQGPIAASYAAGLAAAYNGGGYTDWYMPSKDELNLLYLAKNEIGGFATWHYFSSSEFDGGSAWSQYFGDGSQGNTDKGDALRLRAIRAFPAGALSSAKAITAFSFQGLTPAVVGTVNEAAHTIALTVPAATSLTALVPTITTTGASVSPASGVANNFTNPVTYTVTAADASTQAYTVTVTLAAGSLAIGDPYQGGIIAYILQSGDPGYVAGQTHGLIAATADQTPSLSGIMWALPAYQGTSVPGGTDTALGSGAANTTKIIAQNGAGVAYAAGLARAYSGGGYSDWYLPSRDELNKLYLNQAAIGGFAQYLHYYWSSSGYENYLHYAWGQNFDDSYQFTDDTSYAARVRAIRTF